MVSTVEPEESEENVTVNQILSSVEKTVLRHKDAMIKINNTNRKKHRADGKK